MYGRDLKNNPVILGDEGSITLVKVGAQQEGLSDRRTVCHTTGSI